MKKEAQLDSGSNSKVDGNDISVLGSMCIVRGCNMVCRGTMDIFGEFEGEGVFYHCNIRETGKVTGKIQAVTMEVQGKICGDIMVERLVILRGGSVDGNVKYSSISMDEGSSCNGDMRRVDVVDVDFNAHD